MQSIVRKLTLPIFFAATSLVNAGEYDAALKALAKANMQDILSHQTVVDSINAQNMKYKDLNQSAIDSLDQQWRQETQSGGGELISKVLEKPVSNYLKEALYDAEGLFSEIFIMDNKGLNVGQSNLTSDYWQGDEAKWQQTFLVGADAIHISDIEFDESSQSYQVQVSVTIVDKNTQNLIGAATFGVNAEALETVSAELVD